MRTLLALVLALGCAVYGVAQHARAERFKSERNELRSVIKSAGLDMRDVLDQRNTALAERDQARGAARKLMHELQVGSEITQVVRHWAGNCQTENKMPGYLLIRVTPSAKLIYRGFCAQPRRAS